MADPARRLLVEDSLTAINELAFERGWTDGLPIVPPATERVEAMVAASGLPADELVGILPPRQGEATVERLAANAVMAGCVPEYFPVVIATIEAMLDPGIDLFGANTTTNPGAPLLIVNGPVRNEIEMNCSYGLLGPGNRANATIGRAVSLIMINIAGRAPGEVTKATHSHPGAYTMCFGEYEERSPWAPLHVDRGFRADESTVTVAFPSGTTSMLQHRSTEAEDLLATFAGSMQIVGSNNVYPDYGAGEMVLVLCPDHAAYLARTMTKHEVQEALCDRTARMPLTMLPPALRESIGRESPEQVHGRYVRLAERPEQFLIVVAGGLAGYYSVFMPTMGPLRAVTRPIRPAVLPVAPTR